jgi:two-component system, NtrC family, response regulator PilR
MANPIVLIVDDEADLRALVRRALGRLEVVCEEAATLGAARARVDRGGVALCLCDLRLPDGSGIELLEHIERTRPELPVAMITAHATLETAIAALRAGAFDFLLKPVEVGALRDLVHSALRLREDGAAAPAGATLVGDSARMAELRAMIARVARTQAPVLVQGESGTGKEVVARLLHAQGPRAAGPFVAVNCGAIPEPLLESELFGHRRGAFTGATADRAGLFQAAAGGTLFLDEIAELPLSMQVRLLRALQERAVRPVGAEREVPVDVRVISATHQDLAVRVRDGRFREDLYYRINVIALRVPALRERREDLPALAAHLLGRIAPGAGVTLEAEALAALGRYDFPGNVRELENILERAAALCEGGRIVAHDIVLPDAMAPAHASVPAKAAVADQPASGSGDSLDSALESVERERILAALQGTRWNRTAAAARLGVTLRALRYRMHKLGLDRAGD